MTSSPVWRVSSYSTSGGGSNCVEVGFTARRIAVRDSKDRNGPMLTFGGSDWKAFLAHTLDG